MANDFRYKLYGGATRPDAITGLTTPFSSALMKMYNAAPPDVQRELGLTSGYRSKEVQAQLFNASDRSGRTVAAPGHSRHNFGMAADLYGFGLGGSGPKVSQRARDWVTANAGNFGLNFPMHYEPWHIQLGKNWAGGQPAATDQTTTGSIPPRAQSTLLGAMLRNESGGRNVANTTQGTTSGQAQGYFQITTGTWHDFGGDKYAPTPMGATYAQQADIASKIPLNRWDKTTLAAMNATGKRIDPNRTLGENLAAGGESFGASSGGGPGGGTATGGAPNPASGGGPGGGTATGEAPSAANNGYGPVVTPGGTDPNVPPATDQLTGADKNKPLGGLMGELARSGGDQMKPMEQLQRPSAGQGASLADVVQQYITAHLRGPQQAAQQPQQPQQIPQQILQALQSSQQGGTGFG